MAARLGSTESTVGCLARGGHPHGVAVTHLPLAKVGSSGAEFGVGGMVERWGPFEDRDILLLLAALLGVLAVIGMVYLVVGL